MDNGIIFIKGRRVDQRKLRMFLEEIDPTNIDQFLTDDGLWKSPITGELFRDKAQLWGQLGAYLRTVTHKDPKEPTRAGYVRALRRGLEPTREQKQAHAEYNKQFRRRRRAAIMEAKGIDSSTVEETEPEKPPVKVPAMSWD
jgi:hypothetical protein